MAELRGESAERNIQQNSDMMDLTQMIRKLTKKQGNLITQLSLPLATITVTSASEIQIEVAL